MNKRMKQKCSRQAWAPPQKLDSSAILFSSPRKKDMKRRRRKIDVERQERTTQEKERI